jgi:Mn-containing catalase
VFDPLSRRDQRQIGDCIVLLLGRLHDLFTLLDDAHHALVGLGTGGYAEFFKAFLNALHLKPLKFARDAAEADPLTAIAGGGGVSLVNSMGNARTADYFKITGELDVDLRSNIAAEARAKIVYERLSNFCRDVGTKDGLQFLMTREITHMKAFTAALESMGKPAFLIGRIAPTAGLVDQFFNDSTGEVEHGEIDTRGPCNEGGDWEFVQMPAL